MTQPFWVTTAELGELNRDEDRRDGLLNQAAVVARLKPTQGLTDADYDALRQAC